MNKNVASFILMLVGFMMPMWGWITMILARPDLRVLWFVMFMISVYFVFLGTAKWSES